MMSTMASTPMVVKMMKTESIEGMIKTIFISIKWRASSDFFKTFLIQQKSQKLENLIPFSSLRAQFISTIKEKVNSPTP
jgi:hypothetical protein